MARLEDCTFCDPAKVSAERIIYDEDPDFYSFISNPCFPDRDHSLVVPREHANTLYEVTNPDVLAKMFAEAALLGEAIDEGYGTLITQKYQPRREEGRIKQNHVHVHVWRRLASDTEEIPFPVPTSLGDNDPNGFVALSSEELLATRERVRDLTRPLRKVGRQARYACATQKRSFTGNF